MTSESQDCQRLRASWDAFDRAEPLPDWAAKHLKECAACRSRLGSDPSRLFAVLRGVSPEPVPAWEPLPEGAVARREEAQRVLRHRRAWAVAGAAAVLLATALWLLRPQPVAPGGPDGDPIVAEAVSGGEYTEGPGAIHAAAPPTLESITSPAARVVEFKIFGQQDRVTEVILIFNEEIEL